MPVFIIDYKNVMDDLVVKRNTFAKMSSTNFSNILHDCIKRSDVIIIFVEDSFSVEDVSIKDEQGSPYENLRAELHDDTAKYIPKVAEPLTVIRQIFKPEIYNTFYLNSRTELQDLFREQFNYYFIFKYIYVFFDDEPNETRAEALRRHDSLMKEVSETIRRKTPGAVIAIYTGMGNPLSMEVETETEKELSWSPVFEYTMSLPTPPPKEMEVTVDTEVALFRFTGVSMSSKTRRKTFNEVPTGVTETWNEATLATKMAYADFELEFDFSLQDDGWLLDKVLLFEEGKEVGRRLMGVGAPWSRSYYCGEPLKLVNTKTGRTVTINEYQIQPFRSQLLRKQKRTLRQESMDVISSTISLLRYRRQDDTTADDNTTSDDGNSNADDGKRSGDETSKCFGETVDCGPYFNIPILTGLVVSTVCFCPIAFGIYFLYNCKTHDKYDQAHRHTFVSVPEWCSCCKLPWECCKCAPEWCRCAKEGCICEHDGCQCADDGCEYHKLLKMTEEVPKQTEEMPKWTGPVPKCAKQVLKQAEVVPKQLNKVPKQTEELPKLTKDMPEQHKEVLKQTEQVPERVAEVPDRSEEAPKRAEEVTEKNCDTCDKGLFALRAEVPKCAEKLSKQAEQVLKRTKEELKPTDEVAKRAEEDLQQTDETPIGAEKVTPESCDTKGIKE